MHSHGVHSRGGRYFGSSSDGVGVGVDMVVGGGGMGVLFMVVLIMTLLGQITDLISQDPADRTDRWHVVFVAHPIGQEPVPDLPGEDPGVPLFVGPDMFDHSGGGDPRLAAPDGPGEDGAGLVVSGQDFTDTSMGDPQLAADVTRPDPQLGQFYDPQPDGIGERPPVHKHPSELIHFTEGRLHH